jgi:hypothetical protein
LTNFVQLNLKHEKPIFSSWPKKTPEYFAGSQAQI